MIASLRTGIATIIQVEGHRSSMLILSIKKLGRKNYVKKSKFKELESFIGVQTYTTEVRTIPDSSWQYWQTEDAGSSVRSIKSKEWKALNKKQRHEAFLLTISDGNPYKYEII